MKGLDAAPKGGGGVRKEKVERAKEELKGKRWGNNSIFSGLVRTAVHRLVPFGICCIITVPISLKGLTYQLGMMGL